MSIKNYISEIAGLQSRRFNNIKNIKIKLIPPKFPAVWEDHRKNI